MKKTYTGTMMIPDLTKATVTIECHMTTKYEAVAPGLEVKYTGVKAWSIVSGEDAAEIEAESDGSCIDENHEYLILHFENGETSTFRNSHVDMWLR